MTKSTDTPIPDADKGQEQCVPFGDDPGFFLRLLATSMTPRVIFYVLACAVASWWFPGTCGSRGCLRRPSTRAIQTARSSFAATGGRSSGCGACSIARSSKNCADKSAGNNIPLRVVLA